MTQTDRRTGRTVSRAWLFILALLTLGGLLPLPAAAVDDDAQMDRERRATAALLSHEKRLEQTITLAWKNRPLGPALEELGRTLHVLLSAADIAADEKATVFLDHRPAAKALQWIAEEFGFQWMTRGSGYRISQSAASRRREERLRQEERAAQWSAIQSRMDRIGRLWELTAEQRQARAAEVGAALARPDVAPAERSALQEEQAALGDLARPAAGVALRIYQALTPLQRQQILAGELIRYSTFDRSVSPVPAEEIAQAVGNRAGLPRQADPAERQVDVMVQVSDERGIQTAPERAARQPLRLTIHLPVGTRIAWFPMEWSPLPNEEPPAVVPEGAGVDAALQKAVTLPVAPGVPQGGDRSSRQAWKEDLATVADLAEALHRDAGLEIVADSFIRARLRAPTSAGPVSAVKLLDLLASQLTYSWRKEGNLVWLRNAVYFRDRAIEAPERILASWRKEVGTSQSPSLDQLAALAAALTEAQSRGLYEFWGWYFEKLPFGTPELALGYHSTLPDLRLWAELSRNQRAALLAGGNLPAAQLTARQQQLYLLALQATARQAGPMRFAAAEITDLRGEALTLSREEQRHQRMRRSLGGGAFEFDQVTRPDGTYVSGARDTSQAEPVGKPFTVDQYAFTYSAAGREEPLRRSRLGLRKGDEKPPAG